MNGSKRHIFSGVSRIIRFNWPYFLFAALVLTSLFLLTELAVLPFRLYFRYLFFTAAFFMLLPLFVSWYVYDLSGLYALKAIRIDPGKKLLNIHAGYDEISGILRKRFPEIPLTVCDFFDQDLHTEKSILRARKWYPPSADTVPVQTAQLPFPDNYFDQTIVFLSAHEIRYTPERILFFRELKRVTAGPVYVTEHCRDWKNFLAYSAGFLHFHSRGTWLHTFAGAGFMVSDEVRQTPFITTFILVADGTTV